MGTANELNTCTCFDHLSGRASLLSITKFACHPDSQNKKFVLIETMTMKAVHPPPAESSLEPKRFGAICKIAPADCMSLAVKNDEVIFCIEAMP